MTEKSKKMLGAVESEHLCGCNSRYGIQFVHQLFELRAEVVGYGLCGGELLFAMVHLLAVLPETEADVRPSGKPRAAHIADDVALAHALSGPDARGELGHVQVLGLIDAVVPDLDIVAIATGILGLGDSAITNGHDGGSVWGGIVGSEVRAHGLEHGMQPFGRVARADARELDGCLEECLAKAVALVIEVASVIPVLEEIGANGPAALRETAAQDAPRADGVSVHVVLFEQHLEGIALLDAIEVDGPSVDL